MVNVLSAGTLRDRLDLKQIVKLPIPILIDHEELNQRTCWGKQKGAVLYY